MAFASVCLVLQNNPWSAAWADLFFAFPMLVLWDAACASTDCDVLVVALNDKRIADISDESHIKIYKLEIMLGHLNKVRYVCIHGYLPCSRPS